MALCGINSKHHYKYTFINLIYPSNKHRIKIFRDITGKTIKNLLSRKFVKYRKFIVINKKASTTM